MSWRPTLESVHASRWQAVLAITGGGSGAIAALLEIPGASATLLEARVPYAGAALDEWLGSPPDQAASADTALSMACAAWQRAAQLSPHEPALLGVSCSASLSSDRPKRGEHRIHVACQSVSHTALYSLTLEKGARDRRGEEAVASALVLHALARACDSKLEIAVPLVAGERVESEERTVDPALADVWTGRTPGVWSLAGGRLAREPQAPPRGLLSGSFDPLHAGHEALRAAAEEQLGGPVYFELTLRNADKPPLDYLRLERRRAQFTHAPVFVSRQATFAEKARYFAGVTFVVGVDTALRIVEPRFYDGGTRGVEAALTSLREAGARFLVAGRQTGSSFQTLANVPIPAGFDDVFVELPESEFRADVSSTELRGRSEDPGSA